MREIKFRGKRVYVGEWAYGSLVPIDNTLAIAQNQFEDVGSRLRGSDWFYVIPESVGQFTGLHDKNGVEVYEGDIVLFEQGTVKERREIYFNDGAFRICNKAFSWELNHLRSERIRVIGNIYDNPELIGRDTE